VISSVSMIGLLIAPTSPLPNLPHKGRRERGRRARLIIMLHTTPRDLRACARRRRLGDEAVTAADGAGLGGGGGPTGRLAVGVAASLHASIQGRADHDARLRRARSRRGPGAVRPRSRPRPATCHALDARHRLVLPAAHRAPPQPVMRDRDGVTKPDAWRARPQRRRRSSRRQVG